MQIFRYIIALYIFLALILFALASAVAISFPDVARYAYSVALLIHSISILYMYVSTLNAKKSGQ